MEALGLPDHEFVISHPFFGVNGKNQKNVIISIAYLFEHRPSFTHFGVFEIHGNRSHRRLLRRRRRFRRTRRLPASPFSLLVSVGVKRKGAARERPLFVGLLSLTKNGRLQERPPHARSPPGSILQTFFACDHDEQCGHCLPLPISSSLYLPERHAQVKRACQLPSWMQMLQLYKDTVQRSRN